MPAQYRFGTGLAIVALPRAPPQCYYVLLMTEPRKPPTVGYLKERGVVGATVWCKVCGHHADVSFDRLKARDEMPFPAIAQERLLRCSVCTSEHIRMSPNWPPAHGAR